LLVFDQGGKIQALLVVGATIVSFHLFLLDLVLAVVVLLARGEEFFQLTQGVRCQRSVRVTVQGRHRALLFCLCVFLLHLLLLLLLLLLFSFLSERGGARVTQSTPKLAQDACPTCYSHSHGPVWVWCGMEE
jgi:hypothetical protein